MNEEIYEGSPAKEDVLIGTDSGYNRYRRPDGSTYVHYPYSRMAPNKLDINLRNYKMILEELLRLVYYEK